MVYFRTSPKRCFCTTLQNRQIQKLRTFSTFTKSVMVSVVVSLLDFVESGVKVNASITGMFLICYLLRHDSVVGDNFVFQQDSAPAHGARDTIELL